MKRLNILLVSPKTYAENTSEQKLGEHKFYPFSIVFLVNHLRKKNLCDVDYLDLALSSRDDLRKLVSENKFDMIGFTSSIQARFDSIDMIKEARKLSPASLIATGGFFFSSTAIEAMENIPEIDFIVRGEGEFTLQELVETLSAGSSDFEQINGLSYRKDGKVFSNPPRIQTKELGHLLIDYDIITKPGYDYFFPMRHYEKEKILAFPLMLGRGCNNKCIFCMHRYLMHRVLNIDEIIAQIDLIIKRFGSRNFAFTDPSFSERKDFVKEFCEALIKRNYNLNWYCEGRADIPREMLELMRRAGCISMEFALESGSNKVLKAIRKNINVSQIEDFAKNTTKLGIRTSFFSMVSLPDETRDDFLMTFEMIKMLYKYGMRTSLAPLLIFPGTEAEKIARERDVMPKGFSWFDRTYSCNYKFCHPREKNMPHYLELLTEDDVCQFVGMLRKLNGQRPFYKEIGDYAKSLPKYCKSTKAIATRLIKAKTGNERAAIIKDTATIVKNKIAALKKPTQ